MSREYPERPLVGVAGVVMDQDRVLLVQRGHEPMKGHWSLPGGLLEVGESLHAGVIREVREETGLEVEPLKLIELVDSILMEGGNGGERVRYHYVIVDYLCKVVCGTARAGSDADAVRWVPRAEWQNLEPVMARVIEAGWAIRQEQGN